MTRIVASIIALISVLTIVIIIELYNSLLKKYINSTCYTQFNDLYTIHFDNTFFEPENVFNVARTKHLYSSKYKAIHTQLTKYKRISCNEPLHKTHLDCIHQIKLTNGKVNNSCVIEQLWFHTIKMRKRINLETLDPPTNIGMNHFIIFTDLLSKNIEYVANVIPIKHIYGYLTNFLHYSSNIEEKLLAHQIHIIFKYEKLSLFKNSTSMNSSTMMNRNIIELNLRSGDILRNFLIRDVRHNLEKFPVLKSLYISGLKWFILEERSIISQMLYVNSSDRKAFHNFIVSSNIKL